MMRCYLFHLMPWPHLPAGFGRAREPAWITLSNAHYDPARGADLYRRYLDDLVAAEALGFDGVCVNEHHQTAYGLMPAPNVMAAAIAARTERIRIGVVGSALPLLASPLRVAEEYAMLDLLSRGRLEAGMVIGGGPEYFTSGVNPTHARGRFREALDVILRAWKEPGPFEHYGEHYRLRYVNPWPRPLQSPHPPVWIPSAGSLETIEYVAARDFHYMGIPYFHGEVTADNFARFRDARARAGLPSAPARSGWLVPVYVGASDATTRAELEPHVRYFQALLRGLTRVPPGYSSPRSAAKIAANLGRFMLYVDDWSELCAGGFLVAGGAATVAAELERWIERMGTGVLMTILQIGSMPAELTRASTERFAAEVLPRLRARFGGAS